MNLTSSSIVRHRIGLNSGMAARVVRQALSEPRVFLPRDPLTARPTAMGAGRRCCGSPGGRLLPMTYVADPDRYDGKMPYRRCPKVS